jgi:hypothetical protein
VKFHPLADDLWCELEAIPDSYNWAAVQELQGTIKRWFTGYEAHPGIPLSPPLGLELKVLQQSLICEPKIWQLDSWNSLCSVKIWRIPNFTVSLECKPTATVYFGDKRHPDTADIDKVTTQCFPLHAEVDWMKAACCTRKRGKFSKRGKVGGVTAMVSTLVKLVPCSSSCLMTYLCTGIPCTYL